MATIREHLEMAQRLAEAGRPGDALELCRRVREAAPDQPAVVALEAALLLSVDRAEEALALLERLTAQHDLPDLWANQALAHHRMGRTEDARSACLRALAHNPRHRAANLTLAAVFTAGQQFEQAAECYRRILEAEPACVPARVGLAAASLESGDARLAEQAARLAVSEAPRHAGARITLAAALANLGLLKDSEAEAREAVALEPNNSRAHAVLAEVLVALARSSEALPHLEAVLAHGDESEQERARAVVRAIRAAAPAIIGDSAERRAALDAARSGRAEEAARRFEAILRENPNDYHARFGLGLAFAEVGRHSDALKQIDAAIAIQPALARFHFDRGRVLVLLGRNAEALAAFETGLLLDPRDRELLFSRARRLVESMHSEEALRALRTLLVHHPQDIPARGMLVGVLLERGEHEEAARHLGVLAELAPDDPVVLLQTGRLHQHRGEFDVALRAFERAVAAKPDEAEIHLQHAYCCVYRHEFDTARASVERALELVPDHPRARFNRGTLNLLLGRYSEGWKDYGFRWKMRESSKPVLRTPRWQGEPLDGRTLLLFSEQGLGDSFMLGRMLPLVDRCGGRILLRPHKPLAHFFGEFPTVDELLPDVPDNRLDSVPHDLHAPLGDLLAIFDVQPHAMPAPASYPVDPERVTRWAEWLAGKDGLRVGIAWQGNPRFLGDHMRSLRLELFESLARVGGVRLIALQKGAGREQLDEVAFPVEDLGLHLDNDGRAFADTAAAMQNLDVVIASDSAIVHLAGSLGVPCWTLLAHTPEWRWGVEGESTPWYPGMRLYRQHRWGDWSDVMHRVGRDLEELVAQKQTAG